MEIHINNNEKKNGKVMILSTISSYGAMDVSLETLRDRHNYPNLKRILVADHLAGEQLVHQWGMSSDSWCFDNDKKKNEHDTEDNHALPSVRLVTANPCLYAYLDKIRYIPSSVAIVATTIEEMLLGKDKGGERETLSRFDELEFHSPTSLEQDDCQEYNHYC